MTSIKKVDFKIKQYLGKIYPSFLKGRENFLFYLKKVIKRKEERQNKKRNFFFLVFSSFVFVVLSFFSLTNSPKNFPTGRIINIEEGSSLTGISQSLMEKSVIKSALLLKFSSSFFAKDTSVIAGDYFFDKPLSVFEVAKKITRGDFGLTPVKVTIIEGTTIFEMTKIFEEKFPKFNSERFIELTEGQEGYLFPDTYSFLSNVREDQILKEMRDNFDKKISSMQEEIDASGKSLNEIVIMASIIEKEASREEDRKIISGILWNRIGIGMPLQVDATFLYINGKNTYNLTLNDLKIDSPYNTYKYKGLPVGPISNPSLSALKAAAVPEKSEYLFYLSDQKGNTHYAFDFDEHKKNKQLYMN